MVGTEGKDFNSDTDKVGASGAIFINGSSVEISAEDTCTEAYERFAMPQKSVGCPRFAMRILEMCHLYPTFMARMLV